MINLKNIFILFFFIKSATVSFSQHYIEVQVPDAEIRANKIIRGDGETFGMGSWSCEFSATIDQATVIINGKIIFSEKANDFSVMMGEYQQKIEVKELQKCRHCDVIVQEGIGAIGGKNVGARGYRNYGGNGIIKSGRIMTDTFGLDVGRIGGEIKFQTLHLMIKCNYANIGIDMFVY